MATRLRDRLGRHGNPPRNRGSPHVLTCRRHTGSSRNSFPDGNNDNWASHNYCNGSSADATDPAAAAPSNAAQSATVVNAFAAATDVRAVDTSAAAVASARGTVTPVL